jgi:hypothetical protein
MKTEPEEFDFEEEVEEPKPKRKRTYETDDDLEDVVVVTQNEKISNKDASIRWNNRRRMAWVSLISMILVTFLMMFVVDTSRLDNLETVITWFYMGCVSVVGSYIGFTTYAAVKGIKEK